MPFDHQEAINSVDTDHLPDLAVVAAPETMTAMVGVAVSEYGVFVRKDGESQIFYVSQKSDVLRLVDGMPTVPSRFGSSIHVIPLADELAVLDQIRDDFTLGMSENENDCGPHSLPGSSEDLPLGFQWGHKRMAGGFSIEITSFGIDFKMSHNLALKLDWGDGDSVALAHNSDGSLLAISPKQDGIVLDWGFDEVEPDVALSGLPIHRDLPVGLVLKPEYQIVGRTILFSISSDDAADTAERSDRYSSEVVEAVSGNSPRADIKRVVMTFLLVNALLFVASVLVLSS